MILEIIFLVSGLGIFVLLLTKMRQLKVGRDPLLLRIISLGDAHMRELSQRSAHLYADSKEELDFFFRKQLPLRTRNVWNKATGIIADKVKILENDLRNTKLFKKNGNISEFFKAMSDKEIEIEAAEEDLRNSQNEDNTVE